VTTTTLAPEGAQAPRPSRKHKLRAPLRWLLEVVPSAAPPLVLSASCATAVRQAKSTAAPCAGSDTTLSQGDERRERIGRQRGTLQDLGRICCWAVMTLRCGHVTSPLGRASLDVLRPFRASRRVRPSGHRASLDHGRSPVRARAATSRHRLRLSQFYAGPPSFSHHADALWMRPRSALPLPAGGAPRKTTS
jgi:hypothetical protein